MLIMVTHDWFARVCLEVQGVSGTSQTQAVKETILNLNMLGRITTIPERSYRPMTRYCGGCRCKRQLSSPPFYRK